LIDVPYNDTVGLLGYPDGKKSNDWMKKKNETHVTFMEVVVSGKDKNQKQWDYCTTHWCIRDMEDSIMPYSDDGVDGAGSTKDLLNSQYYFDQCDKDYPGDLDLNFCKTKIPCQKHLPEGKTFEDMVASGTDFSADFEMCCIECMFGQEACEDEEKVIEELQETEDPGIDGDPFDDVPDVICHNMGSMLSGTTGPTKFEGVQPPPVCGDEEVVCVGQDNSYGLFVGGHLLVKMAEDIEGRVYAGGGITIENPVVVDNSDEVDEEPVTDGNEVQLNGIGWATCGSHMCPAEMSRVLEVCGNIDISMPDEEQVHIMPLEGQTGTVVYSGTYKENGVLLDLTSEAEDATLFNTNGDVKRVPAAEVCGIKSDVLTPLIAKSTWWATPEFKEWVMGVYGEVQVLEDHGLIILKQSQYEKGCPLIFDMPEGIFDRELATNGQRWKILFDHSISTNTVLINVRGATVNFSNIGVMQEEVSCMPDTDCFPSEGYAFSTELVANTLWNFPEATSIQFGEAPDICPFTFQGSILAPKADVVWHYAGHRGRFVAGGGMTINRHDAIFFNYEFDPEACTLPQPTGGTCVEVTVDKVDECVVDTYIATDTGKNVCPLATDSIVQMTGGKGWPAETAGYSYTDGSGIIYGMLLSDDKKSVKFNVNVPMETEADIYVKHEVSTGGSSWLEPICEMVPSQDHCLKDSNLSTDGARQFEVACQAHTSESGAVSHYAMAWIYFATKDASVVTYQAGEGVGGATIDKCCYPTDYAKAEEKYAIVEYSFMINCACPDHAEPQIQGRKLRG